MIDHRGELWLIGWGAAILLLGALYLRQRRTGDATFVDSGWGTAIAICALLYGLLAPGCLEQKLAICVPLGVENLRVALLVLYRHDGGEDNRYRELRRRWRERGREQLTFAIFYQAQGLLAAGLSISALFGSFNSDRLSPVQWVGILLWVVAVAFEIVADRQLTTFRRDPANKGGVMDRGLWHYSRHPNYFFQTLTWVAYALIALPSQYGWFGFLPAAAILYLVLFVTGVPAAEESSLRSRGDAYRAYQARTSAFVPWFPKRQPNSSAE